MGRLSPYPPTRPSFEAAKSRRKAARKRRPFSRSSIFRSLLNDSLDPSQGTLRRFLSAWMALEVFVNKNFGAYEKRFWNSLSAGVAPPIRDQYLKRIHEVMRDKYKVLDKFAVLAAELDPAAADDDIGTFQRGKALRDEFAHGEPVDEPTLPVEPVQRLIRKLLRLHLNR
jgi:hypothetical protein